MDPTTPGNMEDYIEGGTSAADDMKYPWEADAQAARVVQDDRLEKAVESGWKSTSEAKLEEIRKFGLDNWIYFRLLRAFAILYLAQALLAAPKLAVLAHGTGMQQRDLLAWIAHVSLGNANPGDEIFLLAIPIHVDGSSFLGVFDALQWIILLLFVLWFQFSCLPSFAEDSEMRPLTAADYAVQVDGLPQQLPDDHNQYEMEVIRHFEALLRELEQGDPHARIYEAALVRDFGRGLYAAQEAARIDALLHGGGSEDDAARPAVGSKEDRKLRSRLETMNNFIATSRGDEAERSVMRAYVICSSQKERSDILREYRFTRLPVVGRCLQGSHLRFHGRWPLTVSAAPEPGDIHWGHFGLSDLQRIRSKAATALFATAILIGASGLCCLCWWTLRLRLISLMN